MVDGQKLMNRGQEVVASPTSGFFTRVNTKLVSIQNLLSGTLAIQKSKLKQKKIKNQREKRERIEDRLEAPKSEKNKKIVSRVPRPGGMGVLGWFKNFIGKILLGFFASRLLGSVGALEGILKGIAATVDVISTIGVGLVNGFATIVDFGYRAFDATKGFLRNVGGEDAVSAFETLMSRISTLIDILLLATLIKGSGDFGGPGRRPPGRGGRFGRGPRRPRPRGPGPITPRPGPPTSEKKSKSKPKRRRPRFNISRIVQLAAAVGGAVGLGVLTKGKGRQLLALLSRAGVVPAKMLEKTFEQSIPTRVRGKRVEVNMRDIMGVGRSPRQAKEELLKQLERERAVAGGGGGGTRTGGGGGRSGGGTDTATGGPPPFRYRKGDYFREGPRDINIIKNLTLQSLKGKEKLRFMMDELIKGSINADTFQRFVFDEAKAGRLSKDDFAKFTGVSSKSSAQNLSATARAFDDARRDMAEDIASRSGMSDLERRVNSPTQQMIDRLPSNREIAKARLARSRGSIEFEGMDDEEIVEYLMKKKRRRNIANIRRQRRLGGIVQGVTGVAQQSTRGIFRAARGALRKVPLKVPLLFGLLDFALAYLGGEPVGRAAFSAIGAGLIGAVGTIIGSGLPGIGNIILGAIGGTAGAYLGEALYDFLFGGKEPSTSITPFDSNLGETPIEFLERDYPIDDIPPSESKKRNPPPLPKRTNDPVPPGSDEPTDRNADDPYIFPDGTILRPGDEVGSLFKVDPTLATTIRSLTESASYEDLLAADTLVINRTELMNQLPPLVASALNPNNQSGSGSGYDAGQELYRV